MKATRGLLLQPLGEGLVVVVVLARTEVGLLLRGLVLLLLLLLGGVEGSPSGPSRSGTNTRSRHPRLPSEMMQLRRRRVVGSQPCMMAMPASVSALPRRWQRTNELARAAA